jgi:hypothetical protein
VADRLALSLINRRQLRSGDFDTCDGGAVLLSHAGRKTVLTAWQERKREERRHPFLDETAPLGLVPYLQAQLRNAFAECVALLGFVVDAAAKDLDASFNGFEPCIDALEAVVDGMVEIAELALRRARKNVYLLGDK